MFGRRLKPPAVEDQPDEQYMISKNKFYGKTLDRETDQWVYLERYLNTLNIRVVRGWLQMSQAINREKQDAETIISNLMISPSGYN